MRFGFILKPMRRLLPVLALLVFAGCFGPPHDVLRRPERRSFVVPRNYDYRKDYRLNTTRLMAAIQDWMGTPYCMGGTTKRCIDCSAFVKNVFKKVNGAKLPRKTTALYKKGRSVLRNDLAVGDLVFFHNQRRKISHVGIYVGDGLFAHASTTVGVTRTSINDPYFTKHYAGARRLF